MHYREMTSPLRGKKVGFTDDLYVFPSYRGMGVFSKMFERLNIDAVNKGWGFVRSITAEYNYRVRTSYDKIAKKN